MSAIRRRWRAWRAQRYIIRRGRAGEEAGAELNLRLRAARGELTEAEYDDLIRRVVQGDGEALAVLLGVDPGGPDPTIEEVQ